MTKKELLENEVFKAMPDDTQIMVGNTFEPKLCCYIGKDDLTFIHRPEVYCEKKNGSLEPIYQSYLIIKTNTQIQQIL